MRNVALGMSDIKVGAVVVGGLQSGLQMHSNGEKAKAT